LLAGSMHFSKHHQHHLLWQYHQWQLASLHWLWLPTLTMVALMIGLPSAVLLDASYWTKVAIIY
jgi:hypothetical protein